MVLFRPCDILARAQERLGGGNYIFSLCIFVIYKEAVFLKSACFPSLAGCSALLLELSSTGTVPVFVEL